MLPYHFLCDLLALDGFTFFDLHPTPFFALRIHISLPVLPMNVIRLSDAPRLSCDVGGL